MQLISRLVALLLLLCGSLPPAPAESAPEPFALPNGLRVVVRERHTTPLVGVELWVRAGAREETADDRGSAHFLEHTLFKGTKTRGPGMVDLDIETLGATLNAATGPDYARFYTSVSSAKLTQALAILADVVRNATLPDAEVERERSVILDELAERDADPAHMLNEMLYAAAFPPSAPYHFSPGGTAAAIRTRGRDTLAAFYRARYTPDHCTLALAGDLTPERARTEALRAFGNWSRLPVQDAPIAPADPDPALPAGAGAPRPAAQEAFSGADETLTGIAFMGPPAHDLLASAVGLISATLLAERCALSRSPFPGPDVRFTPRMGPSLFILSATAPTLLEGRRTTWTAASLEQALVEIVQGLRTSPPTAGEIAAARQSLLGEEAFTLETDEGAAQEIGYADIVQGDPPEALKARLGQVAPADVQHFALLYLDPERRFTAHILPESARPGSP